MTADINRQIAELKRGVVELINEPELRQKLARGKPLLIKAGFDPTAPDIHLGHTVLLRKLRQFQDLGHTVLFLIGDATALVGDPTGQSQTRKIMSPHEVERNAATYLAQVSKILLTDHPRLFQLHRNSRWFGRDPVTGKAHFDFQQMTLLLSKYTVARLTERDDFANRLKAGKPVSMLELFYPLMQGYDSVVLKADVELGGTDQKFNLLVGRELQREYGQEPQVVITMPLLEGTDGVNKMSKSLGNHIGINEPPAEMYGKLMSIPDELIVPYAELVSDYTADAVHTLQAALQAKKAHPRDAKAQLAERVVALYHGEAAAQAAAAGFQRVFAEKQLPEEMPTAPMPPAGLPPAELLVAAGLAKTKNEAKRLIEQGGVTLDGQRLTSSRSAVVVKPGSVLQVGPRKFCRFVNTPN